MNVCAKCGKGGDVAEAFAPLIYVQGAIVRFEDQAVWAHPRCADAAAREWPRPFPQNALRD